MFLMAAILWFSMKIIEGARFAVTSIVFPPCYKDSQQTVQLKVYKLRVVLTCG